MEVVEEGLDQQQPQEVREGMGEEDHIQGLWVGPEPKGFPVEMDVREVARRVLETGILQVAEEVQVVWVETVNKPNLGMVVLGSTSSEIGMEAEVAAGRIPFEVRWLGWVVLEVVDEARKERRVLVLGVLHRLQAPSIQVEAGEADPTARIMQQVQQEEVGYVSFDMYSVKYNSSIDRGLSSLI
jgi:hypothetical protein